MMKLVRLLAKAPAALHPAFSALLALPVLGDLVTVPDAVKALLSPFAHGADAPAATLAEAHALLLALHDAGRIELRPDAGNLDGAEFCPPGPRGSVFATLRIIDYPPTLPDPEPST